MAKPNAKVGRPRIEIDWDEVDQLMMAGCFGTEIASVYGMHADTFYRRIEEKYNVSFTAYLTEKHASGASLLRKQQYLKALGKTEEGDNTLLIWLGKTRLKQVEHKEKEEINLTITPEQLTKIKEMNGIDKS